MVIVKVLQPQQNLSRIESSPELTTKVHFFVETGSFAEEGKQLPSRTILEDEEQSLLVVEGAGHLHDEGVLALSLR